MTIESAALFYAACQAAWSDANRDYNAVIIWNSAIEACAKANDDAAREMCDGYWAADICRRLKFEP